MPPRRRRFRDVFSARERGQTGTRTGAVPRRVPASRVSSRRARAQRPCHTRLLRAGGAIARIRPRAPRRCASARVTGRRVLPMSEHVDASSRSAPSSPRAHGACVATIPLPPRHRRPLARVVARLSDLPVSGRARSPGGSGGCGRVDASARAPREALLQRRRAIARVAWSPPVPRPGTPEPARGASRGVRRSRRRRRSSSTPWWRASRARVRLVLRRGALRFIARPAARPRAVAIDAAAARRAWRRRLRAPRRRSRSQPKARMGDSARAAHRARLTRRTAARKDRARSSRMRREAGGGARQAKCAALAAAAPPRLLDAPRAEAADPARTKLALDAVASSAACPRRRALGSAARSGSGAPERAAARRQAHQTALRDGKQLEGELEDARSAARRARGARAAKRAPRRRAIGRRGPRATRPRRRARASLSRESEDGSSARGRARGPAPR